MLLRPKFNPDTHTQTTSNLSSGAFSALKENQKYAQALFIIKHCQGRVTYFAEGRKKKIKIKLYCRSLYRVFVKKYLEYSLNYNQE